MIAMKSKQGNRSKDIAMYYETLTPVHHSFNGDFEQLTQQNAVSKVLTQYFTI
jgi:hypothetical protein